MTQPQRLIPEFTFQPGQFEAVRDVLARYSGVYLDRINQRTITVAIGQRLFATGKLFKDYIAEIGHVAGRAELQQLAELLLNHETIFFRNQPHMRALRNVLLPQLHRRKPIATPLRIWSAGCSTGEEPYSLAIIAMETLGPVLPRPLEVWATDLSEAALEKARAARYRGRTLSNVTPDVRTRYFDYRGDYWTVKDLVRSKVTFSQINLLEPFPPHAQGVDIIFCQNVTIYFELATFRALVDRFYHLLPEGGLLFLGFSETLWNIYDRFRLQEVEGAFVYVKDTRPSAPALAPPSAPPPNRWAKATGRILPAKRPEKATGNETITVAPPISFRAPFWLVCCTPTQNERERAAATRARPPGRGESGRGARYALSCAAERPPRAKNTGADSQGTRQPRRPGCCRCRGSPRIGDEHPHHRGIYSSGDTLRTAGTGSGSSKKPGTGTLP